MCKGCAHACADPEGGGQGVRTPLKNNKNIGFLSNTGPDPLKNQEATIQCWAKNRHAGETLFNAGGSMMARL